MYNDERMLDNTLFGIDHETRDDDGFQSDKVFLFFAFYL